MNLSNSKYFNSLPFSIRENVRRSGMTFENDEEINSYIADANCVSTNNFFGYPYAQGSGFVWPFWSF